MLAASPWGTSRKFQKPAGSNGRHRGRGPLAAATVDRRRLRGAGGSAPARHLSIASVSAARVTSQHVVRVGAPCQSLGVLWSSQSMARVGTWLQSFGVRCPGSQSFACILALLTASGFPARAAACAAAAQVPRRLRGPLRLHGLRGRCRPLQNPSLALSPSNPGPSPCDPCRCGSAVASPWAGRRSCRSGP